MTNEYLTKVRKMIEAGLRNAKPEEAPGPEEPEHVHTVIHGRAIEGIPFHAVEFTAIATANEAKAEAAEATPCPWVCPTTCLNCGIENCEDRLAGGAD